MKGVHLILTALLVLGGCGGGDEEEAREAAEALARELAAASQPAAGAAPAPTPQAAAPAQPAAAGTSNFGTISLRAGFMPDPHTATGVSGGAVAASTWNASCAGYVSQTPDHLLHAQTAFSSLRVLARSDGDITLVVQRPDGSYVCDDDTEGTDPVVDLGAAAAGVYRIWIGNYAAGASARYTLGVSELSIMPSSLGG
jgi:hypothetical protein